MAELGPTLRTGRLILRPPSREDFVPWCAMMADEEVGRFLGGAAPPSIVWRQFCTVAGAWALYGYGMFSILEAHSGRWIGRAGPWTPHGWPGNEVGWGLVRDAWGKGYATEASEAAIEWSFEQLGWTEVVHCIEPENRASARVAERLGSQRLGEALMPAPYDARAVDIWGQSRDAWRARARVP
jgi:RimJ/RimL family protein N-acetyltransferase